MVQKPEEKTLTAENLAGLQQSENGESENRLNATITEANKIFNSVGGSKKLTDGKNEKLKMQGAGFMNANYQPTGNSKMINFPDQTIQWADPMNQLQRLWDKAEKTYVKAEKAFEVDTQIRCQIDNIRNKLHKSKKMLKLLKEKLEASERIGENVDNLWSNYYHQLADYKLKAKELGITDKLYLIELRQKNRWQRVHENSMRIFKADRNHFFESHEKSNSLYIKAWSFVEESYQRLESIESEFDETEGSVLLNFVTLNVQDFVINCEVVSEIISDLEYVFLIIKDKFEHDVDEFQLMAKSLGVDGKEEEIGFMRKDYEELYKKISKDFPEQLEGLREIKLRFPINVETFFPNAKNNSTNI